MMAKYKTEKRKANVGERILITEKHGFTMVDMTVGNIYEVVNGGGEYYEEVIDDKGDQASAIDGYYEVIVESKPSKSERISLLESQVAELQAKVEMNELVFADYITQERLANQKVDKSAPKLTPNEQRKAVIERAKAFVERPRSLRGRRVKYVIDEGKRTVVALLYGISDKFAMKVVHKAIAKCAPDDVFNADIGKAIALGRALGLDVSEFENAVKPTEFAKGQVITYDRRKQTITEIDGDKARINKDDFHWTFRINEREYLIIDDTDAKY